MPIFGKLNITAFQNCAIKLLVEKLLAPKVDSDFQWRVWYNSGTDTNLLYPIYFFMLWNRRDRKNKAFRAT